MAEKSLHFVLVPFIEQGHLLPALDLALLLTRHGVLVTFVTTPVNLSRNQSFLDRNKESPLPINFLSLRFPCQEFGLPEGCENFDLLPPDDPAALKKLLSAAETLREPLLLHLRQAPPPPNCIISDFCLPWTRLVAHELRIPLLLWYPLPCFTQACEYNLIAHNVFNEMPDSDTPIVVPDLPLRVEITKSQAPLFFGHPGWEWMVEEITEAESSSHGILVNTFQTLEPDFIALCQSLKKKKVWPLGPVSLSCERASDASSRGKKPAVEVGECLNWLNSKEERSVLYVSFGSLVRQPLSQLVELGQGLEATQRSAIWVINAGEDDKLALDEWLADGFEERNKNRIFIVKGWAPQLAILSHSSTGGFISHCGWNSVLEGISAGIPLLTWPCFGDQFVNERLLVDVLKVGISFGAKKRQWRERVVSPEDLVGRERVKSVVERLMGASVEGEKTRKRAMELGKMAKAAMEVGGSSHQSLVSLIEEVGLLTMKKTLQQPV